jgi:hypothetical protein
VRGRLPSLSSQRLCALMPDSVSCQRVVIASPVAVPADRPPHRQPTCQGGDRHSAATGPPPNCHSRGAQPPPKCYRSATGSPPLAGFFCARTATLTWPYDAILERYRPICPETKPSSQHPGMAHTPQKVPPNRYSSPAPKRPRSAAAVQVRCSPGTALVQPQCSRDTACGAFSGVAVIPAISFSLVQSAFTPLHGDLSLSAHTALLAQSQAP